MNIQLKNLEDQTALLTVTVQEADYIEDAEKALRNYQRKANIPGYRPGKVPMGIVNKMYRKGTIAEETYRKATNAAFEYIKEHKIETLGDLMPSEQQRELDFESAKDFEFVFHVGVAPEIKVELTKKDTIEQYQVTPSEEMYSSYRDNFLKRYGRMLDTEVVKSEEALTVELKNDEMTIDDANIVLISLPKEKRAAFIGKKVGEIIKVNINDIFPDARQRASILDVEEKALAEINPDFTVKIKEIREFVLPELNEEFFKMAYPDGSITDKKSFEADMKLQVESELQSETQFKVVQQVRDYILNKYSLKMPEAFLRNWLFEINEGKVAIEDIDKELPQFLQMMRWDLVKREIARLNNINVEESDAKEEAKALATVQFRYYGMNQVGDEMLENFAERMLENREEAQKIYDRVGERKVVDWIIEQTTTKTKKVTLDEFSAMMQQESGVESEPKTEVKTAAAKKTSKTESEKSVEAEDKKTSEDKKAPENSKETAPKTSK